MPLAHLRDRGVVRVAGEDARAFLDGLVTCDLAKVGVKDGIGRARLGALLSPQGKVLFDFILFADVDAYALDAARERVPDLVKRLSLYKLRAKVSVTDVSDALAVVAGWDGATMPPGAIGAEDPRLPALGWRALVSAGSVGEGDPAAYHARRIALGVPEGGRDFAFGDAFPHEALMDQLGGVDFDKGCYVGQEVVSRMQHRGTARTRLMPVAYAGAAPEPGTEVVAGERAIGRAASSAGARGLAMLRLDRLADALGAGEPLRAGGVVLGVERPSFATFAVPDALATSAA